MEKKLEDMSKLADDIVLTEQKKVNDYSRKEIAPIIRYVLREDYNII